MRIDFALFITFVIFVIILCGTKKLKYRNFSSFFLAIVCSAVVLWFICPPTSNSMNDINSSTLIYFTYSLIAILLFPIYSFIVALNDKEE